MGENEYNCLSNNCEHFVMWCIFDIKISLQLQTWHEWAMECVNSICAGGKECLVQVSSRRLVPFFLKVLANVSDEIVVGILSQKYASFVIGVAIGAAIEVGLDYYEIKKAYDQYKNKKLTEKLLYAKITEVIAKSLLRLGLGAAGSAVGMAYGGVCGSLAAGALGAMVGNFLGKLFEWFMEHILSDDDVEQKTPIRHRKYRLSCT